MANRTTNWNWALPIVDAAEESREEFFAALVRETEREREAQARERVQRALRRSLVPLHSRSQCCALCSLSFQTRLLERQTSAVCRVRVFALLLELSAIELAPPSGNATHNIVALPDSKGQLRG